MVRMVDDCTSRHHGKNVAGMGDRLKQVALAESYEVLQIIIVEGLQKSQHPKMLNEFLSDSSHSNWMSLSHGNARHHGDFQVEIDRYLQLTTIMIGTSKPFVHGI